MSTQSERVLDYMKTHNGITPLNAMNELGIMRLGARIYDLKKCGIKIKTERVSAKNRYGETTNFCRYSLEG